MNKLENNLLAAFYSQLALQAWERGQGCLAFDYWKMANECLI